MSFHNLKKKTYLENRKSFTTTIISNKFGYTDIVADTTERGRFYHCPSGSYPSITTILGEKGKDFLEGWRQAVGVEEAARVSRHASTNGENVHTLCEKYLKGEDLTIVMPHYLASFRMARRVLDKNVDNIYLQEFPLFSDELRAAGRVDLIAEYDGELAIIDFKTSSKVKKKEDIEDYFLQETFYALAFQERTGIPINKIVTVMLVQGGTDALIFIESPSNWIEKLKARIYDYHEAKKS